jgi:hypothetical protein
VQNAAKNGEITPKMGIFFAFLDSSSNFLQSGYAFFLVKHRIASLKI